MKHIYYLFLLLLFVGCKDSNKIKEADSINQETVAVDLATYKAYGDVFEAKNVLTNSLARAEFAKLSDGDSIQLQFKAPMNEVCVKKGCWMVLDLGDNESARVTFKDYGFFVPTESSSGTEVIVNGWATIEETTVERLRHLAEDGGKTKEEIEAITEPEIGYNFVADGVLMKNS